AGHDHVADHADGQRDRAGREHPGRVPEEPHALVGLAVALRLQGDLAGHAPRRENLRRPQGTGMDVARTAFRLFCSVWRTQDQTGLIRRLLADVKPATQRPIVFVETGCGLSTLALAQVADRAGAHVYSCELDPERIAALRERAPELAGKVHFLEGDSVPSLQRI